MNEIAYFNVHWKTRKLVQSTAQIQGTKIDERSTEWKMAEDEQYRLYNVLFDTADVIISFWFLSWHNTY